MADTEEKKKTNKPSNSKLKQQKLPAWQPIMTAGTVLPIFFAIGIAFIPLGIALLITSNNVQEKEIDYTTKCVPTPDLINEYSDCSEFLKVPENTENYRVCTCTYNFTLDEEFRGNVFMYYGLTNYYQNHRRYVKSRDDEQLIGSRTNPSDLSSDCKPYREADDNSTDEGVAPCGAIANSLFNDTFALRLIEDKDGNPQNEAVELDGTDISWKTDRDHKFKNPSTFDDMAKPENWPVDVEQLEAHRVGSNGDAYENEDLIVWMRTAALPTFRKLYRKVKRRSGGTFEEGLPKGRYELSVGYAYPVTSFDGTKRMILTTTSWLGGKNPFLGIAYLVVGSSCIVIGAVFLVIHLKIGKKPSELTRGVRSSTNY